MKNFQRFSIYLTLMFSAFAFVAKAEEVDNIITINTAAKIGFEQLPKVKVDIKVKKTRELYVALQDKQTWRNIKTTRKRIKKSGNYHFDFNIDNLKPGNYRLNAYITPRGKDWNSRIGEQKGVDFIVVDQAQFVEKIQMATEDKIKGISYPKTIADDAEYKLDIQFDITEPRDLIIKLLNKNGWKEAGVLSFPVKEPGNISLPIDKMVTNFPAGDYAWMTYLSETGSKQPLSNKRGAHFSLTNVH
ncbi:hypothetical protein C2869_00430 [Saccharobesus litoralis]|uniref:DUF4198 domain-containing protein n=1 Tax=Saccharobesus litoralis TaxID=2172099 RepID=A0A2S0VLC3_9ALTE|nr:hypothetical protein [Saccharobesus litoralis]AWB64997.1 hypothetical protein C2869_00430 [Saccharobesus litoralis]